MKFKIILYLLMPVFFFSFSGCAVIFQKGRHSDIQKIEELEKTNEALKTEIDELRNAEDILQKRLAEEIKDKQVRLKMEDKGLVITFVAEVLFDSGKAVLKKDCLTVLDKVIRILKEEVPENSIGIEGHTDNIPIKLSSWKSNWELSVHRALSVLHYLEKEGVDSKRLSAIGYGEYRPVASNDTSEGRKTNRRVEIVILPLSMPKKVKEESLKVEEEKVKIEEENTEKPMEEEDLK